MEGYAKKRKTNAYVAPPLRQPWWEGAMASDVDASGGFATKFQLRQNTKLMKLPQH